MNFANVRAPERRHVLTTIKLLTLVAALAGCARNPVTGNREFVLISEGQEISMGQEGAKEVEASIGLVDDAELQAYVRRIGTRLAAASERPNLPWRFGVIDDPTPNAFALPGGPIYITRGLMSLMDSEAELAAVLGHEIGHITARHSVSQMSRSQLAQLGLGLGMIFVPQLQNFGNLLGTGMQLLFLKYGRDHERQADDLGFKYSLSESYDVREMDDVFVALSRTGDLGEQRSALPSWLATHPAPEERVERIGQKVAALTALPAAPVLNRTQYLNQVEGMVYGNNPRQGFFRNGEFLHPDLRFRMQFPQGWKTQNMTQAVVAGSPEQDAVIQFTIAQGSPQQAAERFFTQQGLQSEQVSRESINGAPAVTGYFRAQTEQGVIAGLATFIQHGNATYQLLSYTPQQRLNNYDRLFRSVAGSFRTLTDPQVLNIRPNRIDIVRIDSAMTLSQFNQRYPSAVPLKELAVINQVEDANSRLPAGSMLKRVSAS
jgi:predicted Zn-dependent protease